MKVQDAIRWVDDKLHNVYSWEDKLAWLNQMEQMAAALGSRCGAEVTLRPLTADTVLLIPEPFDEIYHRWLEAQIHYTSQEFGKYNNAMAMCTSLWQDYANSVRRSAAVRGKRKFF